MSSFDFVEKVMTIGGNGTEVPTLQFYKKGFVIGSGSVEPTWRDVILLGNTALTLVNAKANGINYLKLFGSTEQRNLPSEYTQVEYIKSSGTQYINTGIALNDTMTIRIKYDYISAGFVFGSRVGSSIGYSGITNEIAGKYVKYIIRYGNKIIYKQDTAPAGTVNVVISPNGVTLNGADVSTTTYGNNFYAGNCYLFTVNNNGSPYTGEFAVNLIRRFTIDNIIDLVPCRRKSDNVLGMYDLVNDTFLTNAGKGTFTAGPDVVPSPDTPMDIVCNNGVIKWDSVNQKIYTDGTTETVEIDTTGGTATAEMLLSVGNYQDVQSVLDGSVTRNVGVKVLDGSEDWIKASAGDTQRFYMTLTDSAMITVRYNVQITHFHFNSSLNDVGVGFLANQILYLYANPDWTVDQFKQWLADQYAQGTPVTILYPLAEPTTETVTPQPLSIQAGTNIITAEGSIDNLPLEVSYKAGVSVTITEVQNAQLDDNVEVIVNG